MKVAVVLFTFNRAQSLGETLAKLALVRVPEGFEPEFIIIDNASTDGTREVVNAYSKSPLRARYICEPARGVANSRNRALACANFPRREGQAVRTAGRDSPTALRSWLDHFDKRFIGLTGSEPAINAAQLAANIPPATKSTVRPDGSYDVGHAAFVLAYTKDNLAHVIYPVGMKQEDWVHDLPLLVKDTWTNR